MDQHYSNVSSMETYTDYANFWVRFVAIIIDTLLVGIPLSILNYMIGFSAVDMTTGQINPGLFVMYPINIVISWLYYAYFESSEKQGTFGKQAMGIKVTGMNGERISFLNATGRYFGKILSSMICAIGYIMAAFTQKKQALHDMVAGTLVLKK